MVHDEALASLFGDGTQAGGLITHTLIGDQNMNPYDNMRAVLALLDIESRTWGGHKDHFHITLQAPERKEISGSSNLLSGYNNESKAAHNPQDVLTMWQPQLNLQGELSMFIADMPPELPVQDVPMMIAQTALHDNNTRTIGACGLYENPSSSPGSAINLYDPVGAVQVYFNWFEKQDVGVRGVVTLLTGPQHGELRLEEEQSYRYIPDEGYHGLDSATFLVNISGYQVELRIGFNSVDNVTHDGDPYLDRDMCPNGQFWKVLPDGTILPLDREPSEPEFEAREVFGIDNLNITYADLEAGALGESNGSNITLDNNANGYGWYVDLTPGLNEEFLPTANPYEWKAAPGSEAEGKIDLLTVLLHEAAHTLGHDHTSDSHALMAATLEPGVRRLPSPELLAELQGLADEHDHDHDHVADGDDDNPMPNPLPFAGLSAFWLGRTRKGEYGSILEAVGIKNERDIQYAVTPNPTLLNPEFAAVDGWNITGDAVLGGNAAVLRESAKSQTRLNQLFTLNEGDRFLRFTLDGINLDDVNAAPDDAFEVALIDANTNQSLLSGNGLSRSDAAINLQANGTEHTAAEVTATHNSDGSRTYVLDLSNIAVGTVVSLSFDLLGFGRNEAATNSQVTVRDLKLGIPETHDDLVTTAEDIPLTVNALANDLDADQPARRAQ